MVCGKVMGQAAKKAFRARTENHWDRDEERGRPLKLNEFLRSQTIFSGTGGCGPTFEPRRALAAEYYARACRDAVGQYLALTIVRAANDRRRSFHQDCATYRPPTTAPKSDNPATIAEATPNKPVARAELQKTKPKSATARAWVQPRDGAPPPEETTAAKSRSKIVMTAVALPLPLPAPKRGSAMLTFTAPPLPVAAPKHTHSAKSDAPPLLKRAPQEARTKGAGSALQQIGRASWYTLDSPTASGEKMDDAALTAAHNFLPFGTKVLIENVANGHSVVVLTVGLLSPAASSICRKRRPRRSTSFPPA